MKQIKGRALDGKEYTITYEEGDEVEASQPTGGHQVGCVERAHPASGAVQAGAYRDAVGSSIFDELDRTFDAIFRGGKQ